MLSIYRCRLTLLLSYLADDHCMVCPLNIGFWVPLWNLQTSFYPRSLYVKDKIHQLHLKTSFFFGVVVCGLSQGKNIPFNTLYFPVGRRDPDRMVVGFTTTYVISAYYTNKVVSSNLVYGEVHSIHHYVIKFVGDLQKVYVFLRVLWFPPQINWTPRYDWNVVESWIKHYSPNHIYLTEYHSTARFSSFHINRSYFVKKTTDSTKMFS
jgi:hypothetical protein